MYPILFNLGPLTVRSYGLFLVLAFIFGTYVVWKEGKRGGYNEEKLLDFSVVLLVSALIGARVYYILLHLGVFLEEPFKAFYLWQGGFAFHGALIGAIVGGYFYTKRVKWPFYQLADLVAVAASLSGAIAKIGAFLSGADYGTASSLPWGVHFVGQVGKRHPVQLYEAFYFLIIFLILKELDKRKQRSGGIFYLYLFLIGLGRWVLEFYRGDSTYIGSIKVAHLVSLVLVVVGLVGLYYFSRRDWRSDLRVLLLKWEKVKFPNINLGKLRR